MKNATFSHNRFEHTHPMHIRIQVKLLYQKKIPLLKMNSLRSHFSFTMSCKGCLQKLRFYMNRRICEKCSNTYSEYLFCKRCSIKIKKGLLIYRYCLLCHSFSDGSSIFKTAQLTRRPEEHSPLALSLLTSSSDLANTLPTPSQEEVFHT